MPQPPVVILDSSIPRLNRIAADATRIARLPERERKNYQVTPVRPDTSPIATSRRKVKDPNAKYKGPRNRAAKGAGSKGELSRKRKK